MSRLKPEDRKEQILEAAVRVAARDGHDYKTMQRITIAKEANCADGLVGLYWPMAELRKAVVRHAVKTRNAKIIVQAIANGDNYIKRIPKSIRQEALNSI